MFIQRNLADVTATVLGIPVLVILVYFPILDGTKSLLTDSYYPPGPLFVGDPIAGGPITQQKQIAVLNAWQHLQLPIWFPFEGYGLTLSGNQAAPWFAPEILFHLLFPHNLSIWTVACIYLSALGAFLLARELKLSTISSLLAGLFYAFTGPMVVNLNLDMINPLMIMPYFLITTKRSIECSGLSRLRWLALNAFASSQLFLSGFDEVLPLVILTAFSFGFVRILSLKTSARTRIVGASAYLGSLLVGFVSSLVATISLVGPLTTYYSFQGPGGWSSHSQLSWLVTLIDPWYFGKYLTGGPYEMGNTVWAYGNPVLFALAGLAVLSLAFRRRREQDGDYWWIFTFCVVVIVGIAGFADFAGILRLFDLPVLKLIVMVRFLAFLWWLPVCILAAKGLDLFPQWSRSKRLVPFLFPLVLYIVVSFDVRSKGASAFPIAAASVVAYRNSLELPLLIVFVVLVACALVKRWFSYLVLVLLSIGSMLVLIPRNFYFEAQPNNSPLSIASFLKSHGYINSLTFSPGDLLLPSALASHGIRTIQAFDVFFPHGYVNSIQKFFGGQQDAASQTSPIWPAAPALMNVAVSSQTLSAVATLGVGIVISTNQIPLFAVAPNFSLPNLSGSVTTAALDSLLTTYYSRPDLEAAFRITPRSLGLLTWASNFSVSGGETSVIAPYESIYKEIVLAESLNPSFNVLKALVSSHPQVVFLGHIKFNGTIKYVYGINPATNSSILWVPNTIKVVSGSIPDVVSSSTVAEVPKQYDSRRIGQYPQNMRAQLVSLTQGESLAKAVIKANTPGLVVFRSQIAPGEAVTVNGRIQHLVPVDGFWTGIYVHTAVSHIIFDYTTLKFVTLFWIDVFLNGLMLLVAATASPRVVRRFKSVSCVADKVLNSP